LLLYFLAGGIVSEIKQSHFRIIGACAPSSSGLARAMARYVSTSKRQTILEVGAGTGAITKQLVKTVGPDHRIDVVEIYPMFANLLKKRFERSSQITVHATDILKFEPQYKYDVIISSLPFNSMIPEVVGPIINRLVKLANPDAILSFYEYKILQTIAKSLLRKRQLDIFMRSRELIENMLTNYKFDESSVKLNLPPARVHYLKLKK
jgi:phospholipid N-methyltransferase